MSLTCDFGARPSRGLRGRTRRNTFSGSVLVLLTLLSCCRSSQHYYDLGNRFYRSGKYADAELNYRNAIQKNPNFGPAVYQLGLTEIKENRAIDAYQTLSKAVALLPADPSPRISLADLLISSYLASKERPAAMYNRIQELTTDIERLQPDSTDALRIRGTLALSDRHPLEAIDVLRRANSKRPGNPDIILPLVQALIQNRQTAEAEKQGLDLIAKHPEFGAMYNVLYLLYAGTNRPADAERIMLLKAKNNPSDMQTVLELANHYRNVGKPDAANQVLQHALNDANHFPEAAKAIGDFYLEKRIPEQAISAYQAGISRASGDARILLQKRKVMAFVAAHQGSQALSLLDDLIRQNPKDDDSKNMKAAILIESGNAEQLASAALLLEDVVRRSPNVPNYHYNLGRAEYLMGKLDEAKRELTENTRLDPTVGSLPAKRLLAAISIGQQQYAAAVRQTEEIESSNPNDAQMRLIKAVALHGLKDYQAERFELSRLLRDQPNFVGAQLQLAYLDIAEQKFAEADDIFHRLYRPGQEDTRALSGLVDVDLARKQIDQARQLVTDEVKRNPQSVPARSLLASLYLQSGRLDLALAEFETLSTLKPKVADFQMGIGQVLQAQGDIRGAAAAFQKAEALDGKSPAPPALAGSALQTIGKYDEAAKEYRESLRRQPGDPRVLNNMAFLFVQSGKNLDEALSMALDAQRKLPGNPQLQDTIGLIYHRKGELDSALQIFENLVRKNPEVPSFHYHLAGVLVSKGNSNAARKELEQALQDHPSTAEAAEMNALLAKLAAKQSSQTTASGN